MISAAIICAYFGQLPGSFEPWLRSCELNPSIDFLLFTDQEITDNPCNVYVNKLSFEEVQRLTNENMKVEVKLEYPYKLCDLKPMYGIIFRKYLAKYDYWGHCDMDVVFGDIRYFLEKYDLNKYDKFLDLGHLSLYRNTVENNQRFKLNGSRCGSWQEVVSDSSGHAFDERGGIVQIFKKNQVPLFDQRIFADISVIYHRFRRTLEDTNYDQQVFYWENGKVYRDFWVKGEKRNEEFIYIHFQKRNFSEPLFDVRQSKSFFVGPDGFTEKYQDTSVSDVKLINPFMGQDFEAKELKQFQRKQKVDRFRRKAKRILASWGKL